MRVARAALAVEVVLCHMSRFVSREACTETVRLSRFTVWPFEALSGGGWHVGSLAARKRARDASGPCIGGAARPIALAGCVTGRVWRLAVVRRRY